MNRLSDSRKSILHLPVFVLVLLGLSPAVGLCLSNRQVRKSPEVSREYITVPANDRFIHIVSPQIESRYEYRLSAVIVVGDDKPDHRFDFYLLHDMETLTLYEQGEEMPQQKYQYAHRVIDWQTWMQTGPGLDFALVFVNPHPYELQIVVKLDYYPMSALLGGNSSSIISVMVKTGMLVMLGVIMGIAGSVQ